MRTPIIAGNWKMYKTIAEALDFVNGFKTEVADVKDVDIIICPSYMSVYKVAKVLKDTNIAVGAQDVFWKEEGAWTGKVAPHMLTDAGCKYVIIGHSETRGRFGKLDDDMTPELLKCFGETDESVNRKIHASIAAGLKPIMCCGETISERKDGKTDEIIKQQVEKGLKGLSTEQAGKMIIAYEPVWAIGTGEVCGSQEANRVCGLIRSIVRDIFGADAAENIRIQYGGSVKPDNAKDLLGQPEIDGALVGGASLKVADFVAIVRSVN